MKFSLSKFHLLCFVAMTFSRSHYVMSEEIEKDKKWKRQMQRVICSNLVVPKYIGKRTMSRDET